MTIESLSAELATELAASNRQLLISPPTRPVRFHHMKAAARSGAHYYHSFQTETKRTDSLSIRLGSGTHALLFNKPVAVFTGKVRRGKEWDNFQALNPFATIVNQREYDVARRMVDSLTGNELARHLLFAPGTLHEQTIAWTQLGRSRQSTPDARSDSHLVELKTAKDANPDRFRSVALYSGYHAQLADQRAAIQFETGRLVKDVYIVACENSPPYAVTCLQLTPRALEQGERLCRLWLERAIGWEQAGTYPSYCESVVELDAFDDEPDLVFGDEAEQEETEGP